MHATGGRPSSAPNALWHRCSAEVSTPLDERESSPAPFGCRRSAGQSRARSREPGESALWHRCSHVELSVQMHPPSVAEGGLGETTTWFSAIRQLVRQPARFRGCSWVYADLRETLGPAETRHPRTPTDPLPESGGQVVAGSNPVSPTEKRAGRGVFVALESGSGVPIDTSFDTSQPVSQFSGGSPKMNSLPQTGQSARWR
jgi:hypothetical protein